MKLKLTPELFILQDVSQPPECHHASSQEEEEEKKRAIVLKNPIDLDLRLKQINRTKRLVEAPEFRTFSNEPCGPNQSRPFKSTDRPCDRLNQNELNQNKAPNKQQQSCQPAAQPPSLASYLPHLLNSLEQNLINKISCDKRLVKRRPTRDIIQSDIRCVTLSKDKYGSFGLTIKGGLESNKPLVISGIQRGSAADKCRSLFAGDLIVQLNGQPTYPLRLTHEQAMKAIKAGGHRLYLTVKHLTMYNRPIGRIWHRQLNTFWLDEGDNKAEVADWPSLRNSIDPGRLNSPADASFAVNNQFSSNKSSSQESYTIQTPLSSSNQDHLSDSEQYSNCETATLSNLTVTDKDKDEPLLTPSPHDEGVYTGLSNDALSSSECTSDASGFSSDYTQQSLGKQPAGRSNSCSSNHQPNQNSSSYLQRDPLSEINCSACSSTCKNRTNNNRCTKCIVNKNHPLHNVNTCCYSSRERRPTDLPGSQTMNLINPASSDFRTPDRTKEHGALNGFAFRSTGQEHSSGDQSAKRVNNGSDESDAALQRSQTNDNRAANSCSCSLSSSSTSRNSNRTSLVDIVSVSLINCYFTKYISNTDTLRRNGMEVQWFSSHNQSAPAGSVRRRSADVNSAVISFNDADLAQQFQQKIHHYLTKLNESYMFSFSRGLRPQERILYMGWVSLALPKSATGAFDLKPHVRPAASSLDYNWQPKYMIIRGGELLLYDCVPDYLLDKLKQVPYANDTLIEFNELSRLLANPNGALTIALNGGGNLNSRPRSNSRKSARLTRHLSIRGRDSSFDPSHRFHVIEPRTKILTEYNNSKRSSNGNRLISTLTRNLSLKTAKENRYNKQPANKPTNPHCTLPRSALIDRPGASSQLLERNLKRTGAESNLLKTNDFELLNQQADRQQFSDIESGQPQEAEWENQPIIFKAYQSVLRQLKPEEQLDKRENCLLALTTQSDSAANPMSTFRKQSTNRSTGELQENSSPNAWYGPRKSSLDEQRPSASGSSVVAYLSVEHANNIPQILRSWNVCTMHSVIQLSQKSFPVVSEGRYGCLTLDWNTGFTLYDGSNAKWSFKFSQLKNSSDDGCNTLWLSFQSIVHQPVKPAVVQRPLNAPASFGNQSDNSSLSGSLESVDQYSQRGAANHRAMTPSSFDSSNLNGSATMNSTLGSSNQLNGSDYYASLTGNYPQTNRTEFRIMKSIETKELTCSNLQHLIYCMHSFLSAKVTNVASIHNQQLSSKPILV